MYLTLLNINDPSNSDQGQTILSGIYIYNNCMQLRSACLFVFSKWSGTPGKAERFNKNVVFAQEHAYILLAVRSKQSRSMNFKKLPYCEHTQSSVQQQ